MIRCLISICLALACVWPAHQQANVLPGHHVDQEASIHQATAEADKGLPQTESSVSSAKQPATKRRLEEFSEVGGAAETEEEGAEGEHGEGEAGPEEGAESHEEGHEAEGEGEGHGEEGEEGEEEEHFTDADIEVACMLLGSVAFVIGLFYLVNWPDDDIRRYSWEIISKTISIFTAVMMFQAINKPLHETIHHMNPWLQCTIHFMHCLVYLVAMQLTIGIISGALFRSWDTDDIDEEKWVVADPMLKDFNVLVVDPEKVRNKVQKKSVYLDEYNMEVPVEKKKMNLEKKRRRMKCWATILAHMSGFAAINAGGSLQQMHLFSSPKYIEQESSLPLRGMGLIHFFMAFLPVIITEVFCLLTFNLSSRFRALQMKEALSQGRKGVRAQMCNEECDEAENDVSSLSISFLTVQAVRYWITGILPGVEGIEEVHGEEWVPAFKYVWMLYVVGMVFGLMAVILVVAIAKLAAERDGQEETKSERMKELIRETALNSSAMSFGWCILWATRWAGVRQDGIDVQSVMGRVVIALILSAMAFLVVFVLDKVDDAHAGVEDSQVGAQAIQTIIGALGVLVGFSWEHCFDGGVEAIASQTDYEGPMQLFFAFLVVAFIVPAWRRHILTKVMVLDELKQAREAKRKPAPSVEYQPVPVNGA